MTREAFYVTWVVVFVLLVLSPAAFAALSGPWMLKQDDATRESTMKLVTWWLTIQFGGFGLWMVLGVVKHMLK